MIITGLVILLIVLIGTGLLISYGREEKPSVGKWYPFFVCIACKHPMTSDEIYHSNGTCPHCGHNSRGTIADTEKIIRRRVKRAGEAPFYETKP